MEMKLELVLIPVADVDRAKTFYVERLGFVVRRVEPLERPLGEQVGGVAVGVLVALLLEGRVLVSYQRGLLDEVGHGSLVKFGADVHACLVRRSGRVGPCTLLAVGLGVVDDP